VLISWTSSYSDTGVLGEAELATAEKGKQAYEEAVKQLVRFVAGHKIDDSLAKETARRIAKRRASAEGKEGLAAFLAKRKPEWNA